MKKSHRNYSNNNKGTVLFIVLVFILAVTALVLISSIGLRSEVDFVENEFNRLRAYTRCISGMEFLKNRLLTTTRNEVEITDMLGRSLTPRLVLDGRDTVVAGGDIIRENKYRKKVTRFELNNMVFYLSLQDSAGLINVFAVERPLFRNLFEYYGFPAQTADVVLDSLYDWMDDDDFTRPNGAESKYYLANHGYTAANRLIYAKDEMLLVKGMDKDIFNDIGKLLDFTVENEGINPNTMPAEAFYLFKGLTPEKIDGIIRNRQQTPYTGAAGMTLTGGFNFSAYPKLFRFFTSKTTYVKIKAQMNENRFFHISFRLEQIAGGGSMRAGRRRTFGPGTTDRNPVEDFYTYFHISFLKEGTERNEEF